MFAVCLLLLDSFTLLEEALSLFLELLDSLPSSEAILLEESTTVLESSPHAARKSAKEMAAREKCFIGIPSDLFTI